MASIEYDAKRFSSLAILHAHKARTLTVYTIQLINVATKFVSDEHRTDNFGKFVDSDLWLNCKSVVRI